MSQNTCPICGKPKKPWFKLCFDCNEKEKKKPTCEVCGREVREGYILCNEHWKEKQEEKKKLEPIDYVKPKEKVDFREKFEGRFYFNGMRVKSKSELLLLYFFEANDLKVRYEDPIYIGNEEYRPDFVIEEGDDIILIEHFGMSDKDYENKREAKIKQYKKLCQNPHWFFVWTDENDIYNLKDNLGKKLNETSLKRIRWK